ncbi:DUF805 domain-containing protein [Fructobacillus sp. M158]|uniref:DUF805 domain-containing protein n=1 Tax=Fructobacillus parabroussonetiae TaxID=2713174 RepID=UPI00200B2B2E|nr:DUF805 domain-containing protein [Fructobacillus parabroussonetiae]MCK8617592.1 DUF805 domain-containing protein [Fructobacillus parabroussonetiae]
MLLNLLINVLLTVIGFGPLLLSWMKDHSFSHISAGTMITLIVAILLLLAYTLATIIPTISISYRRMIDTGLSPWWFSLFVLEVITNFTGEYATGLVENISLVVNLVLLVVLIVIFALPTNKFNKQSAK